MKNVTTIASCLFLISFLFLQGCTNENEKYLSVSYEENNYSHSSLRLGGMPGVVVVDDLDAIPATSYTYPTTPIVATADADGHITLTASLPSCDNANACVIVYELVNGNTKKARVLRDVSFPLSINQALGCLKEGEAYKIQYIPVNRNSSDYVSTILPKETLTYCN